MTDQRAASSDAAQGGGWRTWAMSQPDYDVRIGLDAIRRQIRHWIDFDNFDGLKADDAHLIAPPTWPSHGQLKAWVTLFGMIDERLSADGEAATGGDEGDSPNEPCGGCGETDPAKRCIGCLHPFNKPSLPQGVREAVERLTADLKRSGYSRSWSDFSPDLRTLLQDNARLEAEVKGLRWLSENRNRSLELSFGYDDEEEPGAWMVHQVSGGRNDREWTLIAKAATAGEAIERARQALARRGG